MTDAWHDMPGGPRGPETRPQRAKRIRGCLEAYRVPFPCLVDWERRAEDAYAAFPQRLVLVGSDGDVEYDAGRGLPDGWDLDAFGERLKALRQEPVSE